MEARGQTIKKCLVKGSKSNSCSGSADSGNLRKQVSKKPEQARTTRTLNPILVSFSESTKSRPSKTNAGLFISAYTFSQSISLNSFHSVAMTTASACLHASMAELHIVICFLT